MSEDKFALIIVDGIGLAEPSAGNLVAPEYLPTLFDAMDRYGYASLEASGPPVGLYDGQVGNSEVGHLTIGAGRVLLSPLKRIDEAFESGSWSDHPAWQEIVPSNRLHVLGLLSDAGVHAHWSTIVKAVRTAKASGVKDVIVHPVLDGVDSNVGSAAELLKSLQEELPTEGVRLGVVMGRSSFCDRSGDLAATSMCCASVLENETALPVFSSEALADHMRTVGNESSFPAHLVPGGVRILPGESTLHTSHRADRARQIVEMLTETQPVFTITTVASADIVPDRQVFFPVAPLSGGLMQVLASHGIWPVRVAETCKFPHVTYFMNGYHGSFGEKQVEIPEHGKSLVDNPEMNAGAVADAVIDSIEARESRLIVANIANLDQVGHSGSIDATHSAAEAVEKALQRIYSAAERHDYTLILMSDHGNADRMEDAQGCPFVGHTEAAVPFTIIPNTAHSALEWSKRTGSLADVAPTVLSLMKIPVPNGMNAPLAQFEPVKNQTSRLFGRAV